MKKCLSIIAVLLMIFGLIGFIPQQAEAAEKKVPVYVITAENSTVKYKYNSSGLLEERVLNGKTQNKFTYSGKILKKAVSAFGDTANVYKWTYKNGKPVKYTLNGNAGAGYTYNSKNYLTKAGSWTYKYDSKGRVSSAKYKYPEGGTMIYTSRSYGKYDAKGNLKSYKLTEKTSFGTREESVSLQNKYNSAGRLVKIIKRSESTWKGNGGEQETWNGDTKTRSFKYKKMLVPKSYVSLISKQQQCLMNELMNAAVDGVDFSFNVVNMAGMYYSK